MQPLRRHRSGKPGTRPCGGSRAKTAIWADNHELPVMGKYVLRRLGLALVVIVLSMVFLGVLVHLVPGDPARIMLGPRANEALSQLAREEMHLDLPVPQQVRIFLTEAVQGDLGRDFVSRIPVPTLISESVVHTIVLAVAGLGLAVLVGVTLGIIAAAHPNGWADRSLALISVARLNVPAVVAGWFLWLLVAVQLPVLPAIAAGELSDPLDYLRHVVLPTIALSLAWIGYIARLVRTSMLEVLG